MYNLNFFTVAFGYYKIFVIPYIISALYHNTAAKAEIMVDSLKFLKTSQKDFLNTYFKNRWTIRKIPSLFSKWKAKKWKKSIRWLSIPNNRLNYTYIGDIDIMITDRNLHKKHVEHAHKIGKPYSNIVRPNGKNMTGLHFVITDPYYFLINRNYIIKTIRRIEKGEFNPKQLDERLLFMMVKDRIGINNSVKYRPGHGLHLSPGRPIIRWAGNAKQRAAFNTMRNTKMWKDALNIFHPGFLDVEKLMTRAFKLKEIDLDIANKIKENKDSSSEVRRLTKNRSKLRLIRHKPTKGV